MSDKVSYSDHAGIAALPITQRPETVKARKGEMARIRRHHIDIENQSKLMNDSIVSGRFVSPYRRGGGYWGIIETLSLLGENQEHSFSVFWDKFMEVMNDSSLSSGGKTPWEKFSEKPVRSKLTGKNVIEKVHQNVRVLQRLGGANPYGLKLAQMRACIDVLGSSEEISLRLRTGITEGADVVPMREINKREFSSSVRIPAGYSVTVADGSISMSMAIERATSLAGSAIKDATDIDSGAEIGAEIEIAIDGDDEGDGEQVDCLGADSRSFI